jgi:hypothetical protein
MGAIIRLHGMIYAQEYGFDHTPPLPIFRVYKNRRKAPSPLGKNDPGGMLRTGSDGEINLGFQPATLKEAGNIVQKCQDFFHPFKKVNSGGVLTEKIIIKINSLYCIKKFYRRHRACMI